VAADAAGLDSLTALSPPVSDFEGSALEPESDDLALDSVFVSEPAVSDPLEPLDFSELDRCP
jgi:hypothetical protein